MIFSLSHNAVAIVPDDKVDDKGKLLAAAHFVHGQGYCHNMYNVTGRIIQDQR